MSKTKVNGILLIYHHNMLPIASNMFEHIHSFQRYSRFKVWMVNIYWGFPCMLKEFEFQAIILHYSLFGWFPFALDDEFRNYLADSESSYKVAFFQDEYRFWAARAAVLNQHKVDCVYTCIEPAYYQDTYWKYTKVPRLETYLPGYISDEMVETARQSNRPMAERAIDVGYRGRQAYHYMGRSAREKHEIGVQFRERAAGLGLTLDIETDEAKRIYGEAWLAFLGNCRATLGVESGVSIFDIDDVVVPACERLLHEEPDLSFDQVYERLLKPYDGVGVYYRTVSPRVFEAAATGTCQILYEGKYSGVVEPWVHYLPLRKDFANFDEIIRLYRDEGIRRQVVQQAERDLIASGAYSYRRFIAQFDAGLVAAGLEATITEATVQRVSDALRENERELWMQKLHAKQAEYDQLLQQHIALQVQYMDEVKLLVQQNLDSVAKYDQLLQQ
ncbi:MAG TPA: glycosyltransferase, partial [Candidatus Saccharimonadales bacterium]|nr:glycosyltransferase [Candidatus Saccharimonadales bacterium]